MKGRILVVDDTGEIYEYCSRFLKETGFEFEWVRSGKEAQSQNLDKKYSLILLDKDFSKIPKDLLLSDNPREEGLTILKVLKKKTSLPIIIVTAYPDPLTCKRALELGAEDHIEWNALRDDEGLLICKIEKALKRQRQEKVFLIKKYNALGLIGSSPPMIRLFEILDSASKSDIPVLLVGETGVGKELCARAIHETSEREGPFVPVSLGAIPKDLIESELFGVKKGAFTGATEDVPGLVEYADQGTLFLDEISELPLSIQVKILRFLEERSFRRIGERVQRKTNTRLISATNRDLEPRVQEESFRDDLYYRIRGLLICVPPLRERREDIHLLIEYFLKEIALNQETGATLISKEALRHLERQIWPGNVRELKRVIQTASLSAEGRIVTLRDVIVALETPSISQKEGKFQDYREFLTTHTLSEIEREAFRLVWEAHNGKAEEVAKTLGISLATVYNKKKELGL